VVFTTAHGWPRYPFGDDLRVLAQSGATVGHCPYKYAKMAMTLQSFQRYLEAGVNLAIGTDTSPMDIVAELRWASILAKVTDANYQVGLPRRLQRGDARRMQVPGADRSRPPGTRREGRPPADQPRPPRGARLRRPDQGPRRRRLGSRRGHRHGRRQGPRAGRPHDTRERGRGLREGAAGDRAVLESRGRLALGRRDGRSHRAAGLPDEEAIMTLRAFRLSVAMLL